LPPARTPPTATLLVSGQTIWLLGEHGKVGRDGYLGTTR
jgi:hypothetical protein